MDTVHCDLLDYGHQHSYNVRVGANMDLRLMEDFSEGKPRENSSNQATSAHQSTSERSSRWPLAFVRGVAAALRAWRGFRHHDSVLCSVVRRAYDDYVASGEPEAADAVKRLAKFDMNEWRLHLQRDHLPYRRDCRWCVENSTGRHHRKIPHPSAYAMALDIMGPFRHQGYDKSKYMLVGAYRFPKLPGSNPEPDSDIPDPPPEHDPLLEDSVPIELPHEGVREPEGDDAKKEREMLEALAEPFEYATAYLVRPLRSRTKADVLRGIQELYIHLRSRGFPLLRIHSDRAREFTSDVVKVWAASRDIDLSTNQGDDPQSNSTAERGVRRLKSRMRVVLNQAREFGMLTQATWNAMWPAAANLVAMQQEHRAMGLAFETPAPFGSSVWVKRKKYGLGKNTDLDAKWIEAVYLGPVRSVPGGHLVRTREHGHMWYTTSVRRFDPPEFRVHGKSPPDIPPDDDDNDDTPHDPRAPGHRLKDKTSPPLILPGKGLGGHPGLSGDSHSGGARGSSEHGGHPGGLHGDAHSGGARGSSEHGGHPGGLHGDAHSGGARGSTEHGGHPDGLHGDSLPGGAPSVIPKRRVTGKTFADIVALDGLRAMRLDSCDDASDSDISSDAGEFENLDVDFDEGMYVPDEFSVQLQALSGASGDAYGAQDDELMAQRFIEENRYGFEDCVELLEATRFHKPAHARTKAWTDSRQKYMLLLDAIGMDLLLVLRAAPKDMPFWQHILIGFLQSMV